MDIRSFKTDATREKEGVWQSLGEGGEVLIARWNNPRCSRLFSKLIKPFRRQIDAGTMDPKKSEEILARVMAETILLDWRGFFDGNDPLEYSTETAFELLKDVHDFRELIKSLSEDAEAYRERELEDAEGN